MLGEDRGMGGGTLPHSKFYSCVGEGRRGGWNHSDLSFWRLGLKYFFLCCYWMAVSEFVDNCMLCLEHAYGSI